MGGSTRSVKGSVMNHAREHAGPKLCKECTKRLGNVLLIILLYGSGSKLGTRAIRMLIATMVFT
jgi:hypothetical protein